MQNQEKISLREFNNHFCSEERCINYLLQLRWPDGFVCPNCGSRRYYGIKNPRLQKCANYHCGRQVSATAGTIFHRSKVPLQKWFQMLYYLTLSDEKKALTEIDRELNMTYKTTWIMRQKVRLHNESERNHNNDKLAGLIAVDGSYYGYEKTIDGKERESSFVLFVVRFTDHNGVPALGQVDVKVLPDLSAASIQKYLNDLRLNSNEINNVIERINRGDWWSVGKTIHDKAAGHQKTIELYNIPQFPQWRRKISNSSKKFLRKHQGVSITHLQPYLEEFITKFNSREEGYKKFDRALEACISGKRYTAAQLFGHGSLK